MIIPRRCSGSRRARSVRRAAHRRLLLRRLRFEVLEDRRVLSAVVMDAAPDVHADAPPAFEFRDELIDFIVAMQRRSPQPIAQPNFPSGARLAVLAAPGPPAMRLWPNIQPPLQTLQPLGNNPLFGTQIGGNTGVGRAPDPAADPALQPRPKPTERRLKVQPPSILDENEEDSDGRGPGEGTEPGVSDAAIEVLAAAAAAPSLDYKTLAALLAQADC